MNIEVRDESSFPVPGLAETELAQISRYVLDSQYVHPQAELSILLVDIPTMSDLHMRWMDEPGPTDVISIPMDELQPGQPGALSGPGHLGDIILCPEVAAKQARDAGKSTVDELLLLTTHGVLHLLGYDHAEPEEEREMFDLQRKLLLTFLAQRV